MSHKILVEDTDTGAQYFGTKSDIGDPDSNAYQTEVEVCKPMPANHNIPRTYTQKQNTSHDNNKYTTYSRTKSYNARTNIYTPIITTPPRSTHSPSALHLMPLRSSFINKFFYIGIIILFSLLALSMIMLYRYKRKKKQDNLILDSAKI